MPVPTQPQTPDEMIIRTDDDDAMKVERDSDSHSQPPPDFHSSTRDPKRPADAKTAAREGVVHEDTVNTENDPRAVRVMKDEAKHHAAAPAKPQPAGTSDQESNDPAAVTRAASRNP